MLGAAAVIVGFIALKVPVLAGVALGLSVLSLVFYLWAGGSPLGIVLGLMGIGLGILGFYISPGVGLALAIAGAVIFIVSYFFAEADVPPIGEVYDEEKLLLAKNFSFRNIIRGPPVV